MKAIQKRELVIVLDEKDQNKLYAELDSLGESDVNFYDREFEILDAIFEAIEVTDDEDEIVESGDDHDYLDL